MREALAGLTLRGRAFLAAGTTALVCAVLLGQEALTRVGVLVLALPLATAWLVGRSRYRLSLERDLSPAVVPAGTPARVGLALSNQGRAPGGSLLLEDQVPYVLGTRPRFVLEGIGRGWSREVSYEVRSDVRGRHTIGPMTIRVRDPFGLVDVGRAFRTTTTVVVTPRVSTLPHIGLGGAGSGGGEDRARAFAVGSSEDVTVRDYRRGDDLRRVHWPSSARTGELMVRREEQPWHSRATVWLDDRASAHRGRSVASSLEAAVAAAASVAAHLGARGYDVRLVTAAGPGEAAASAGALLESLALVEAVETTSLDLSWVEETGRGGLTVAVLGALGAHDLSAVRLAQQRAGTALALALDVDGWAPAGPGPAAGSSARLLSQHGWRAVPLGPATRLEDAWLDLGHLRSAAQAPAAASAGATR